MVRRFFRSSTILGRAAAAAPSLHRERVRASRTEHAPSRTGHRVQSIGEIIRNVSRLLLVVREPAGAWGPLPPTATREGQSTQGLLHDGEWGTLRRFMSSPLTPPLTFDLVPFGSVWLHWKDVERALFPGRGKRCEEAFRELRRVGGIYLLAWSEAEPTELSPAILSVKYVGETDRFMKRMGQFGRAAGFWGPRKKGQHSAGERWPKARHEHLWVLFFPFSVPGGLPHLVTGLRKWLEALALDAHAQVRGSLPQANLRRTTVRLDTWATCPGACCSGSSGSIRPSASPGSSA